MIELKREESVFVLHFKSGENRFNREFLTDVNGALDEVEKSQGPAALVTTGEGKFYSNGLDLTWLMGPGAKESVGFVEEVHQLFARILAFPLPTIAAMNGHAFAGGAMLATAHDFRVMRSDRGYYCLPEIELRLPFTPGMTALLTARLPKATAHEAMVTGKRYGAAEAKALKIVDEEAPEAEVLPKAIARAKALAGKDRATLAAIKRGMYASALAVLNAAKKK
ncbi:MAG: enoyl-CoA hydratase/isomerase family protein [Bdellovibrionota bacterium]